MSEEFRDENSPLLPVVRLNLACPYCNSKLKAQECQVGYAYQNIFEAVGFKCEHELCGAEWDVKGVLREEPSWMIDSEFYAAPNPEFYQNAIANQ